LGESQRLAMARLFFHKPKFAIIDEATSACSSAMETTLYERCQELGIAYITICHRPALKRFHTENLNLTGDGKGGWELHPIERDAADAPPLLRKPGVEQSMHTIPHHVPVTDPEKWVEARSQQYLGMKAKGAVPRRGVLGNLALLLPVVLPGSLPRLALLLGTIVLRTAAHEAYGRASGTMLGATLSRDSDLFRRSMLTQFGVDVATAWIDEGATWLQNEIGVHWGNNLSRHAVGVFFRDNAFYNARSVDRRVRDPDQRVTQEVSELAQAMASVFASSLTPLLDASFFGYRIYSTLGAAGALPLAAYAAGASAVLALAMPDHAFYNTREKEFESQYRFVQTRLKTHAESIAFLGGGQREHQLADEKLMRLVQHLQRKNRANCFYKAFLYALYEDVDTYSRIVTTPDVVLAYMQLSGATSSASSSAFAASNAYVATATEKLLSSAGKLSNLFESVSSALSSASRVVQLFDVLDEMHKSGHYR
jgi:ABC-type uncharacterized transport system fused permease/ATPase subunit